MASEDNVSLYVFPKWVNRLPIFFLLGGGGLFVLIVFVFWYWFSPKHLEVGYMPKQPIPYSHRLHVSELGLDCRYCHTNVETAAHSNVPSSETCLNCHNQIKVDSPHIKKIKQSAVTGVPIQWVKVHKLPDYAYFNHSRHINSGISCVSCHGRVDQMEVVHQAKPLSMSWCLECHRAPEQHLRPKKYVFKLDWKSPNQVEMGRQIKEANSIRPGEDCSTCHR